MANAGKKALVVQPNTLMTYEAKQLQLMRAAQTLGIEFQLNIDGVAFHYDGHKELFSSSQVNENTWWLDETYEPWFFSIRREELEENARMTDVVLKLRNTFGISERELLNKFVKGGGTF